MDQTILEDLGLKGAEIKVYIALLEIGSSSAGKILERSGLQNSVVHRALNSLIDKGLISYILEGKHKVYNATDPDNFYDFIEDKKKKFTELLPELKRMQEHADHGQSATVFKGKRGINELYKQLLNETIPEYNSFGGGRTVTHKVMGEVWWKNLHAKRMARKIPSRQIFDESIRKFGTKLNKQPITQIKFLPKEFEQLQETVVAGSNVGIAIFSDTPYGILISDESVASGYRKQFELLWSIATL